jgi:hypothetical protein
MEGKPTKHKKWSLSLTCFKAPKKVVMDSIIKAEITWEEGNPVSHKTCHMPFQAKIRPKSLLRTNKKNKKARSMRAFFLYSPRTLKW